MTHIKTFTALASCILIADSFAQTQTAHPNNPQQQPTNQPYGNTGQNNGAMTGTKTITPNTPTSQSLVRSSQLLGRPITSNGQNIGKLQEMMIDQNTGRIVYGVSTYDFSGATGRLYPMPWGVAQYSTQDQSLGLNVPAETLSNAASFPINQWPNFTDQQFANKTFSSYNENPWWTSNANGVPSASQQHLAAGSQWSQQPTSLSRLSEIRGRQIVGTNGAVIGTVNDVVVDPTSGRALYAIESSGGQLHPIPWNALRAGSNNNLQLNMDPTQFKNAPGFQNGQWPNMTDPTWQSRINQFYTSNPNGRTLTPSPNERTLAPNRP